MGSGSGAAGIVRGGWVRPAVMVLAAGVLLAATPTSRLETFRTRFYRLHTDLPAGEARDLARFLDAMFVSYARVFRYREHRKAPLNVYVFRSREDFLTYSRRKGLGPAALQLQGFFSPDLHLIASFGSGEVLRRVLAHEGTHQFVTMVTRPNYQPPLWFHEGLATYFETASWEQGKLLLGELNRDRLAELSLMRREGRFVPLVPLRQLLTARQFTPAHYGEAWSFVYFLLHGHGGRNAEVLNRYFQLIQQREDPVEAFAQAFRAPLAKVERAWRDYVEDLLKQNHPGPTPPLTPPAPAPRQP